MNANWLSKIMSAISNLLKNAISSLKGGGADGIALLKKKREEYRDAERVQHDHIEKLKAKLRQIDARLRILRQEHADAKPIERPLIERQIREALAGATGLRQQEAAVFTNLDRLGKAVAKIDEILITRDVRMNEGDVDDITIEAESAFKDAEDVDRALREMTGVTQSDILETGLPDAEIGAIPETNSGLPADLEAQMNALFGSDPAPPSKPEPEPPIA